MDHKQTILVFAIGFAFLSLPAHADGLTAQGLEDPEVIAPASADWTGPYVGLTYGRTSAETSSQSCRKVFDGVDYGPYACDDPVFDYFPGSKVVDTETTSTSSDDIGAFAGWRYDFGDVVGGIEVGAIGDMTSAEVQVGLDLGRVLAYGLAGGAKMGDESGAIYGAGVDVSLGQRWLLGIKHTTGDAGDLTTLRVGIRF